MQTQMMPEVSDRVVEHWGIGHGCQTRYPQILANAIDHLADYHGPLYSSEGRPGAILPGWKQEECTSGWCEGKWDLGCSRPNSRPGHVR